MTIRADTVRTRPEAPTTKLTSTEASGHQPIQGDCPATDRTSLHKLVSQLVATALSPFSSHTSTATDAERESNTGAPAIEKSERPSFFNRFLSRLHAGVAAATTYAIDVIRGIAALLSRTNSQPYQPPVESTTSKLQTSDPTTAAISHSEKRRSEELTELLIEKKHTGEDPSVTVAEATRKSSLREQAVKRKDEADRAARKKIEAAEKMRAIDAENGITNPEISTLINTMMGSFGEESSAIRAIIGAQVREFNPRKEKA